MNAVVKLVTSGLPRRLFVRPFNCGRHVQKSRLASSSSGDSLEPADDTVPTHSRTRSSFADRLRQAQEKITDPEDIDDITTGELEDSSQDSYQLSRTRDWRYPVEMRKPAVPRVKFVDMFTCTESNPANHRMEHEGLYYTVSPEDQKLNFPNDINPFYKAQTETFGELTLMIRKPALEIIDVLRNFSYKYPMPKFIIYGQRGAGKTLTLNHVIHYCGTQNHVILHIPWVNDWLRYHTTSTPSVTKPGFTNLPDQAQAWLRSFATRNASLIKDMTVSRTIAWTTKDVTHEGGSLQTLINFGVLRIKYADDVVDVVLDELMQQASEDKVKLLVVVDGLNGFYRDTTIKVKFTKSKYIHAKELSLVNSFRKLLSSGIKNSAAVCTVSEELNPPADREKYTPLYLLGKEGFVENEPFIPVHVENYTEREANNCLDLYEHKLLLQNEAAKTEEGRQQLLFLTNKNPHALSKLCTIY